MIDSSNTWLIPYATSEKSKLQELFAKSMIPKTDHDP